MAPGSGTFGGDENLILLLARAAENGVPSVERWPRMSKAQVAERLVARIAQALAADAE